MTGKEVLKILAIIKVAYPNSFKNLTKADVQALTTLWERQFKDFSYDEVAMALDSIIASDTSDFMPSIGKIKEMIVKLKEPEMMTELEAWQLVKKALSRSGYYAKEEFDKLPPIIQKVIVTPNTLKQWAMEDTSNVNTVIASNFQRSYRAKAKAEKEMLMIPIEVRETMQKIAGTVFKRIE